MSKEKVIKIVLLGESGVGKTNLIQVAIGNPFKKDNEITLSSSYYESNIIIQDKKYLYSLWDTAGQEVYRSMNKLFINDSRIVIIVFAIDDRKSFEEVDFWVNFVRDILEQGKYIMALVGNKSDLFENQQIPDEEIKKKGESLGIKVKITSAAEDSIGFKLFLEELLKDYIKGGFLPNDAKTFNLEEKKTDENEEENNKKINEVNNNNVAKKKKRFC